MKKSLSIIIANAPVKNGNKGCVALTYSCLKLILQLVDEAGCTCNFYLTDSYFDDGKKHFIRIDSKEIAFEDVVYPFPVSFKWFVKNIWKVKMMLRGLKVFLKSDFVLDIGQGDSFADIYGIERFNNINHIHKLAKLFHKPYCFLPQTIGPFKNQKVLKMAKKSIKEAASVLVRDKESFDFVKENIPTQKKLAECIDVAFFLPYKKCCFDKTKIHVGLNISGLLWNGGYTGKNQFELKGDYPSVVRRVIDFFLKKENVVIHLVSHVLADHESVENDYEVSRLLYDEFNDERIKLAPFFLDPMQAKGYIAGLDFFVGARMHATIAAFSSGVPVVPMAYSRKFNGLFSETLFYRNLIDLKYFDEQNAVCYLDEKFTQREALKKEVDYALKTIVSEKENLLKAALREYLELT